MHTAAVLLRKRPSIALKQMKVIHLIRYALIHRAQTYDQVLFAKETSTATLEDLGPGEKILVCINGDGEPSDACFIQSISKIDGKDSIVRHIHSNFRVEIKESAEGGLPIDLALEKLFFEVIPRMEKNGYRVEAVAPAMPASKFYARRDVSGWMEKRVTTSMLVEGNKPRSKAEQDAEVRSVVNVNLDAARQKIRSNIQTHLIKPMLDPLVLQFSPVDIIDKWEEKEYVMVNRGERLTEEIFHTLLFRSHRLRLQGDTDHEVARTLTEAKALIWKLMGETPWDKEAI